MKYERKKCIEPKPLIQTVFYPMKPIDVTVEYTKCNISNFANGTGVKKNICGRMAECWNSDASKQQCHYVYEYM